MAFADPKTYSFDYQKEIAAAIEMFPPLRDELFFVEVHQQELKGTPQYSCHGPAWDKHKNIPAHVDVVRRAVLETLSKSQPRAVRGAQYPDVKFVVLFFSKRGRPATDMIFVFDHQIGHHLVPAACRISRGEEFIGETGADAFAAIRFMQRFGREAGKKLLAQKSADRLGSPATAGHYRAEWRELTAGVLLRIVKDADISEFEGLSPHETVEMADYIAQSFPTPELRLKKEAPEQPTEEDWVAAAEQGGGPEQHELANRYMRGIGVAQDFQKALNWYKRAAEGGYAPAQHLLGFAYHQGIGAPKDTAEALKWYSKAAGQGLMAAEWAIGIMHEFGDGVPKDEAKAADWYRSAASKGDPGAAYALGTLYRDGRGVKKDAAEWQRLCNRAANAGFREAQYAVAGFCADKMEEAEWLLRAAVQGYEPARKRLVGYLEAGQPLPPAVAAAARKFREEGKR